ncbi:glutathione S-transferase [Thelonectria olida]|uniref:Glutathione S-transferase n=1 Tax=Thelonectria olida TaxID=1576542 RepID=A0A9P8VXE7_9HYPO|nr:glutathione S-transferase [Thelonectria olida]
MTLNLGPSVYHKSGSFTRPDSAFRDAVSRDPNAKFPAEKGRYALYLSPGCPWAHRTLIVRLLKGLEDVIDVYQVHLSMGPEGWYFSGEGESLPEDPLHGFKKLKDLYFHADPNYVGRYTVPVLYDKKGDTIVNNESAEIIRMLYTEFDDLIPEHLREENRPGGGLYPQNLRDEINQLNTWVYDTINNGVYKVGFAKTQQAYSENIKPLFESLDRVEELLSHGKRYLLGDTITEADVRLYTTIARFDVAYHPVFLCNLKSIRHDYPRLYLWLRRLYWDQDENGELRAAFFRSTSPYLGQYAYGYADSRKKIVYEGNGPLIVPLGPQVLIDPLP